MRVFTTIKPKEATHIPEPPIATFLFADTRMAWFWLLVRLYVGYQWLTAGLDKLTGHSFTFGASFGKSAGTPWVFGTHNGAAIKGFVAGALTQATGAHPAVQGWYGLRGADRDRRLLRGVYEPELPAGWGGEHQPDHWDAGAVPGAGVAHGGLLRR